jgi:rare lipoprotein A (peptidoglycan hydrolase)
VHALVFVAIVGIASWFNPSPPYTNGYWCASNTIPIGTHISVENYDTHAIAHCIILGTGPFIPGRILDVSYPVAKQLGMVGAGTIRVSISREVIVHAQRAQHESRWLCGSRDRRGVYHRSRCRAVQAP